LNQNDSLAWYNRACLHVKQGQLEKAIAALKRAIELHAEFADTVIDDPDFDPIRDRIQFLKGLVLATEKFWSLRNSVLPEVTETAWR
jgi:tetratricopeptide (TPR) repeat protein